LIKVYYIILLIDLGVPNFVKIFVSIQAQ
jgi:hypothetical protein